MLDWENLKTLQALSDAKTVRGAAQSLGIHHATVSRRIEQLEQALGTRLVDRKPEGMDITSAGHELVAVALNFSNQIQATQRRLEGRDSELSGRVILTLTPPMGETLFASELPAFADRYPLLELHIESTTATLDLSRREADIAIRIADNPTQSLIGKRICSVNMAAYANRNYLSRLQANDENTTARWVGYQMTNDGFDALRAGSDYKDAPVWGRVHDVGLHARLVKEGLGFGVLPCIVGDRAPSLIRLNDGATRPYQDLWLLTHNDLRHTARIRAVMDFAEQVLRKHRDAFEGNPPDQPAG